MKCEAGSREYRFPVRSRGNFVLDDFSLCNTGWSTRHGMFAVPCTAAFPSSKAFADERQSGTLLPLVGLDSN